MSHFLADYGLILALLVILVVIGASIAGAIILIVTLVRRGSTPTTNSVD